MSEGPSEASVKESAASQRSFVQCLGLALVLSARAETFLSSCRDMHGSWRLARPV